MENNSRRLRVLQPNIREGSLSCSWGLSARLETHLSCDVHASILHDPSKPGEGLLWYSKTPLREFDGSHAPSWTRPTLDGIVSLWMPEPLMAHCSVLVRNISFKVWRKCKLDNPHGICGGTCLSGIVSFVGPTAKLHRGRKLKDVQREGSPDEPVPESLLTRIVGTSLIRSFPQFHGMIRTETGCRCHPSYQCPTTLKY